MAITSLLLSNGVGGLVPAADVNIDPNNPVDPAAQHLYNTVCIQVRDRRQQSTNPCCPESVRHQCCRAGGLTLSINVRIAGPSVLQLKVSGHWATALTCACRGGRYR